MSSSTSQSPLVVISPPSAPAPTDSCIVPSINKPQTVERSETVTTTTTSHGTTLEASSSPLLGGHLTLDRSLTVNTVNTIDTIGTFDGGPAVNAAARKPTIGRRVTFNLDNNTNDSHSNRPSRKSTLTSISSTSSWVSFKERFFPARKMSVTSQQIASNLFPKSKGILPPTILAVVEFEKLPELISLKRHIKSRLNNYRFSSVPTPTKNPSVWEWQQCEGFDAGENFILASIRSANNSSSTGKKSTPTLIEYLESIAFREWNMQKPLWKIHILENQDAASPVHLEMNDEGVNVQPISRDCRCVIILETHHSIGDGISMIQLAHSMFSDADGKQFQWENTKHKRPRLSFLRKLGFIAAMPIHFFKSQSMFMLSDSNHKFKQPRPYKFNANRKIVFFPDISLDAVKAIKDKSGTTVNDVLTGALSGGIYRYLEAHQDPMVCTKKSQRLRIFMPFAFPKSDGDLHNAINFLSVPLPVSSKFSSPELRLKQVNRTMNSLKYSPAPLVTMKLQKFVAGPLFPASLRKAVTMKMFSKHTMVFSNVPGVQRPLYLCGEQVLAIRPMVPNVMHECTLVSYNGAIHASMAIACKGKNNPFIEDPDAFVGAFVEELKELAKFYEVDLPITI